MYGKVLGSNMNVHKNTFKSYGKNYNKMCGKYIYLCEGRDTCIREGIDRRMVSGRIVFLCG